MQDSRRRLWQQAPRFDSLDAVNDWLQIRCVELWHDIRHPELPSMTVAEVWAQEQSQLMPTPRRFDGFVEHSKPVSPTCLVNFERCRYSVPAAFANRRISLQSMHSAWCSLQKAKSLLNITASLTVTVVTIQVTTAQAKPFTTGGII